MLVKALRTSTKLVIKLLLATYNHCLLQLADEASFSQDTEILAADCER